MMNEQEKFLLQIIAQSESDENISVLLTNNLEKINLELVVVWQTWVNRALGTNQLSEVDTVQKQIIYELAQFIYKFAVIILVFPLGNPADNIEISIGCLKIIDNIFNEENYPEQWVSIQQILGSAYRQRIREKKSENLEKAIFHLKAALRQYTETRAPFYWAGTQCLLGNVYIDRIEGEKRQNLETAIAHYQAALRQYTPEKYPRQCAATQCILGEVYIDRIEGEKRQNLETAISYLTAALNQDIEEQYPVQWAENQYLLGSAYIDRIEGEKKENLELAITYLKNSLRYLTEEKYPHYWASTQHALGIAYRDRIKGEKAQNIEEAIKHFQAALKYRTEEVVPLEWARIQHALGTIYDIRIKGEKAQNIEEAIAHYQAALRQYSEDQIPLEWAMVQNALGVAYTLRIKEDEEQNLENAIAHFNAALKYRTEQGVPLDWAMTQQSLGNAYLKRVKGEKAQNIEEAIAHYQAALRQYTKDQLPLEWAMTHHSLGVAYSNRIQGEKTENIETAISHYQAALGQYPPFSLPFQCSLSGSFLGNLAFKEGKWEMAIFGYSKAVEAIETSRSWIISDERRQELLKNSISIYENLVQSYINTNNYTKALEYAERSRAKRLVDLMASNDLYHQGEMPPEVEKLLKKYEELQEQINSLPNDLKTNQSEQLYYSKQEVWAEIRNHDPVLAGEIQVNPLTYEEMGQLLDKEDCAILSFFSTENDTHIFILRPNQPLQIHTCREEGINKLHKYIDTNWFIPSLEADKNDKSWFNYFNNIEKILIELVQRLQIREVVAQYLQGIEELIIVPHFQLHLIPFCALPLTVSSEVVDSKNGNTMQLSLDSLAPSNQNRGSLSPTTKSEHLGDRFRIRIVPSLQILNYCAQRPPVSDNLSVGIVENATSDRIFASTVGTDLKQRYQIPENLHLRGKQATTKSYLEITQQVNVLHCIHHASSDLNNPLESALQLADGKITVGTLMTPAWRRPNLVDVYLCCCKTNFTFTQETNDPITLATAFLCAGARNVLGTLWSVDELATSLFSIIYHEQLSRNPNNRSLALQSAQIKLKNLTVEAIQQEYKTNIEFYLNQLAEENQELLQICHRAKTTLNNLRESQTKPFAHPYYWAAFTSQGLTEIKTIT